MMNYTREQEKVINDYLAVCIKNNYHCQHCAKNDNGICFFAFQCFMNDMMHFDNDDDPNPCDCCDIPDNVDESNYDPFAGCDTYEVDEMW